MRVEDYPDQVLFCLRIPERTSLPFISSKVGNNMMTVFAGVLSIQRAAFLQF